MKKYRRVMSHDTEVWCKVWKKLTLGSKNDMTNLVNFNVSSNKSENLHFDLLLLSTAYRLSAKKVQKNYLWWHWKKIQSLKEKLTFCLKIEMRSLVNFNLSSGLKICTLMGYFCRKHVMFELKKYSGVMLWKMTYGFKNDK